MHVQRASETKGTSHSLFAQSDEKNRRREQSACTFLGHKCVAISCHIKRNMESNARIFLAQLCPLLKTDTIILRNEIIYVETEMSFANDTNQMHAE